MAQSKRVRHGPEKLRIREAVMQDVQKINEIHNQGIIDRESVLDITPHPLRERLAWFRNLSDREAVLVADSGGYVIGFTTLQPYSPEEVYSHIGVPSIWVEKDFRGRGIGNKLARRVHTVARKKGYRKLMFFAYSFNREKLEFYKKMGYEDMGVLKSHARIRDEFVDVLVMEYLL